MTNVQRTNEHANTQRNKLAVLMCMMIIACIAILTIVARNTNNAKKRTHSEQAHIQQQITYHNILGKTHSGARLTSLEQFINSAPNSPYIFAARIQYTALKTHEATAWAAYTHIMYDLRAAPEKKTQALETYTQSWGQTLRSSHLGRDTGQQDQGKIGYKYKTAKSPYTAGKNANALAGAPQKRKQLKTARTKLQIKPSSKPIKNTQDVRTRKARAPIYPRSAKRRGISAEVVLHLDIDERGKVIHIELITATARRYKKEFIRAARRAAKRSRFYPKTINGKPVIRRGYQRIYTFRPSD